MADPTKPITRGEFLKLAAAAGMAASASPIHLIGPPDAYAAVGYADTVLLGGKVVTMEDASPVVEAVAIQGGLIQAIGSDVAVKTLIGPQTRQIALAGRTVTPGFVDSHCHLEVVSMFGPYYKACIPPQVTNLAALQASLAAEAAVVGAGEWVKAYYLGLGADGTPDRWDLDSVSPDNPVFLMQQGGHFGTANTLALQIAGITTSTANPLGGIIERTAGGEPTGVLYNHHAMDLVRRFMPEYTDEQVRAGILPVLPVFAAFGVTSFHDNNIRGTETVGDYQQVARDGNMFLRSTLYFTLEYPSDLNLALNSVPQYESPFCHFAGSKFLIDGQMPTAYCHEPHNGTSWQTTTWDISAFKNAVRVLHAAGHQICVHCVGDAAVDLVLDAYEEAMNAHPRSDPRHRIEHCVLTKPESTQRIKDLGVVISTQPPFIKVGGDSWRTVLGDERMDRIVVTREWLDAGIPVALSSDSPTTPWFSPQVSMAFSMDRTTQSGRTVAPGQEMTIEEAMRAATLVGAYASHDETTRGSLAAGKYADLVVWNFDPYTMTPAELRNATANMTLVGGEPVYPAGQRLRRRLGPG